VESTLTHASLVYNVFSHDYEGFVEALQGAIANPMTEGFLEPTRSELAVREGVTMLMETDWEAEARDVRTRRETEENRVYVSGSDRDGRDRACRWGAGVDGVADGFVQNWSF
jgi:hypothetical protein